MIIFYLSNAIVYVFCTYYVFSSFLLCCNASAFVICAIKNYLLTYLILVLNFIFTFSPYFIDSCVARRARLDVDFALPNFRFL